MWAKKLAGFDLQALTQNYVLKHDLIWLDSASISLKSGRYSYLCIHPVESIPTSAILGDLRHRLQQYAARRIEHGPPFQGGLVGFFDYEFADQAPHHAAHFLEKKSARCHFRLYDTVVALDHHADCAWIISSGFTKGSYQPSRDTAEARINAVQQDLSDLSDPEPYSVNLTWQAEISEAAYLYAVRKILAWIRKGDIYQANYAQTFTADLPGGVDPFHVYLSIRTSNPAPFSAYAVFGERAIACTSPERLITVSPQGRVESRPIKGTIARSMDPTEDEKLGCQLLQSAKDRAENIMIVDLVRNDLSRVCKPNSVSVPELCILESYAGLHQLTSSVQGQLKEGLDGFDAIAAVFPGGSVTGAPKRRSMQIIDQLEQKPRDAFCGAFGYFGFDGGMDFNIMIRTVQFQGRRARLDVGSGITSMSIPEEEHSETLLKANRILRGTAEAVFE